MTSEQQQQQLSLKDKLEQLCFQQRDLNTEISNSDVFDLLKYIVDEIENPSAAATPPASTCVNNITPVLQTEHLLFASRVICTKSAFVGPVFIKVQDQLTTALEASSKTFSRSKSITYLELLSVFLDCAPAQDCLSFTDATLNFCRKKGKQPAWFPYPKAGYVMGKDEPLLLASINLFAKYLSHPSFTINTSSAASAASSSSSSPQTTPPFLDTIEIKCLSTLYKYVTAPEFTASTYSSAISTAVFNIFLFLSRSVRPLGKEFAKWLHSHFFMSTSLLEPFIKWLEVAGRGDAKLCGEIVSFGVRHGHGLGGNVVGSFSPSPSDPNGKYLVDVNILKLLLQQSQTNLPNTSGGATAATALCSFSPQQAFVETPLFLRSVFVHALSCQVVKILSEVMTTEQQQQQANSTSGSNFDANFLIRDLVPQQNSSINSSSSSSNNNSSSTGVKQYSYCTLRSMLLTLIVQCTFAATSADQIPLLVGVQCLELVFSSLSCDGKISTLVALLSSLVHSSLRQVAAENCGLASAEDLGPALTLLSKENNSTSSSSSSSASSTTPVTSTTNSSKTLNSTQQHLLSIRVAALLAAMQRGLARMSMISDSVVNLILSTIKCLLNNPTAPVSEAEIRTSVILMLELFVRLPRPFPVTSQIWKDAILILSEFVDAPNKFQNKTSDAVLPLVAKRISSVVCAIRIYQSSDEDAIVEEVSDASDLMTNNNNSSSAISLDDADPSSHSTSEVRRKVLKLFYDFICQKAFFTLCHLQTPLSVSGIPAAALSASLNYYRSISSNSNNSDLNVLVNQQHQMQSESNNNDIGIQLWWDQAVEFVISATAPPPLQANVYRSNLPATHVSAQQHQQQQQQTLSMSTMRASLAILHESWQARYLSSLKKDKNNNNSNGMVIAAPTNWVNSLATLISDNKAPTSVRADALGMFSRLPASYLASHYRQIHNSLATILASSYSCASSVIREIGEDPLLAHSSCWSVLHQCCGTSRLDGYTVVQRGAPRIHTRGLLPSLALDSQQQLVTSAISTFSRVVRFLSFSSGVSSNSYFRDIVTIHFDVFTKLANNTNIAQGGTLNNSMPVSSPVTNGAAVAAGSSSSFSSSSSSAADQQLRATLYQTNPLISSVNRSTVLLNTLSSLVNVLRSYAAAFVEESGNENQKLIDRQTVNLLVEQFLGKVPVQLLVPSALAHSTDLSTCILSSRCVAILSELVPNISSRIVQPHVNPIFLGLVLRECSTVLSFSRRRASTSSPQREHLLATVVSVCTSVLSQQWANPWSPSTPMAVLSALHALVECLNDHSIESLLGASVQSVLQLLMTASTSPVSSSKTSSTSADASLNAPIVASMNSVAASLVSQLLYAAFDNQWVSHQQQQHDPRIKKLAQAVLSCSFFRAVSPLFGSTSSDVLQVSIAGNAMQFFTKTTPNSIVFDFLSTFWHHPSTSLGNNSTSIFRCIERAKNRIGMAIVSTFQTVAGNAIIPSASLLKKKRRINFLLSLIASEPSRSARNALNASLDLLLCRICGGEANADTVKIIESFRDILRMRPSRIVASTSSTFIDPEYVEGSNSSQQQQSGSKEDKNNNNDGIDENNNNNNNNYNDDEEAARQKQEAARSNQQQQNAAGGGGSGVGSDTNYPGVSEFSTKLAILRSLQKLLQLVGSSQTSVASWWGSAEGNPKLFTFMNRLFREICDTLIATIPANATCSFFLVPFLNSLLTVSSTPNNTDSASSFFFFVPAKLTEAIYFDSSISVATALRKIIDDFPSPSSSSFHKLLLQSSLMQFLDSSFFGKIMTKFGTWVGECWKNCSPKFPGGIIINESNKNNSNNNNQSSSTYLPKRDAETVAVDALMLLVQLSKKSQGHSDSNKAVDLALTSFFAVVSDKDAFWEFIAETLTKDLFFYVLRNAQQLQVSGKHSFISKKLLAQLRSNTVSANVSPSITDKQQQQQRNEKVAATGMRPFSSEDIILEQELAGGNSPPLEAIGDSNSSVDDDDVETATTASNNFGVSASSPKPLAKNVKKITKSQAAHQSSSDETNSDDSFFSFSADSSSSSSPTHILRLHFLRHRLSTTDNENNNNNNNTSAKSILEFVSDFLDFYRRTSNNNNMSRLMTTLWVSVTSFLIASREYHTGLVSPLPSFAGNSYSVKPNNRMSSLQHHANTLKQEETLLDNCTAALCALAALLRPDPNVLKTSSQVLLQNISSNVIDLWLSEDDQEDYFAPTSLFHRTTKLLGLCLSVLWHLIGHETENSSSSSSMGTRSNTIKTENEINQICSAFECLVNLLEVAHQKKKHSSSSNPVLGAGMLRLTLSFLEKSGTFVSQKLKEHQENASDVDNDEDEKQDESQKVRGNSFSESKRQEFNLLVSDCLVLLKKLSNNNKNNNSSVEPYAKVLKSWNVVSCRSEENSDDDDADADLALSFLIAFPTNSSFAINFAKQLLFVSSSQKNQQQQQQQQDPVESADAAANSIASLQQSNDKLLVIKSIVCAIVREIASENSQSNNFSMLFVTRFVLRLLHSMISILNNEQQHQQHVEGQNLEIIASYLSAVAFLMIHVSAMSQNLAVGNETVLNEELSKAKSMLKNAFTFVVQNFREESRTILGSSSGYYVSEGTIQVLKSSMMDNNQETRQQQQQQVRNQQQNEDHEQQQEESSQTQQQQSTESGLRISLANWT